MVAEWHVGTVMTNWRSSSGVMGLCNGEEDSSVGVGEVKPFFLCFIGESPQERHRVWNRRLPGSLLDRVSAKK
jgi:hypothetical protein